ncbi:MAG: VanZ family protein [Sedimentisphaerales bacterium]|nr:VanZ family protein [Sedimentisphaerales bacterium]
MALFRRRTISIISLALYWPALLVFAHIPVPESVRKANVSDKSLHFLAYLVLAFLLWFSVKPDEKVNWRKKTVWLILIALTIYGVVDEVVQSFIGRTCDAMDVASNFAGALLSLLLLTFISFNPGALIVAGIVIFAVANISKANLAEMFPLVYGIFNFFTYVIFTVFWILNMNRFFMKKRASFQWLIFAMGVPLFFLLIVKISSLFLGREIEAQDIIVSADAIAAVACIICLKDVFLNRMGIASETNDFGNY